MRRLKTVLVGTMLLFCSYSHAQSLHHVAGDLDDLIRFLSVEELKDKQAVVAIGNVDYCEPCRKLAPFFEEYAKKDANNVYVELKVLTQPITQSKIMQMIKSEWQNRKEGFTYASDINDSQQPTFAIPTIIMLSAHDEKTAEKRRIIVDEDLKRLRMHTSGLFNPVVLEEGVKVDKATPNFFLYRNIDPKKDSFENIDKIPTFLVLKSWIADKPYIPYAKYHVRYDGKRYFYELKENQEELPDSISVEDDLDLGVTFKVQEYMGKTMIQKCTKDSCEVLCVLTRMEFKIILMENGLDEDDIADLDEQDISKLFVQRRNLL
jgi:thiol-disulfide isomerase/thioredoxin